MEPTMTSKDQAIQVTQELLDDATDSEIARVMCEEHEREESLRRFDERVGAFDDDLTDEEWRMFIAHCFADSLKDPREDIYTAEDGEPAEKS
jgi:hypothetical protein